ALVSSETMPNVSKTVMGVMYPRPKPTIAHSPSCRDRCGEDVWAISCAPCDTVLTPPSDRCGLSPAAGAAVHARRRKTNYRTGEAPIWACWGTGSIALDTVSDHHAGRRGAVLPGIEIACGRQPFDCCLNFSIIEDDH